MYSEMAVLGDELAQRLLNKGYELVSSKEGTFTRVYYFVDTEELYLEIEKYLSEIG